MANIVLARVEPFTDFVSEMVRIVNTLTLPKLRPFCTDYGSEDPRIKGLYTYPLRYDNECGPCHPCREAMRLETEIEDMEFDKVDSYVIACAEARLKARAEATHEAIMRAIYARYDTLRIGELVSLYGFSRAKRIMHGLERDPRAIQAEEEWYEDAIGRAERRMEFANDSRMAGVSIDWDTFSSL